MKLLNLKKNIEFKHNIENIVYENFNNYSLTSLNNILSYIIDDIIELIENDDEIEIDDVEIVDISGMIKENLLNRYYLYNCIISYVDDDVVNVTNYNNLIKDQYNLIQFNSIMNLLNDYNELIYEIDEKKFYDILNNSNDEFDDDEFHELFYEIKKIENNKYEFHHYEFSFNNHNVFITYEIIDNNKLLTIFFKYIDPIVEKIHDEIIDDIKNYFKYNFRND